ncbi:hypothetical protein ACEPPN_012171 [Leptodophora sp. 'Broadleaf-Isolate-01']
MYLPFPDTGSEGGLDGFASLVGDLLRKRGTANNRSITITELASQWANPSDVSTILMIIGGDVVQNALAQSTGKWYTPVCFSFGWVSYAFIAVLHCVGDGRLLPPPDYPVKLINLKSGYARDNKNWVIGRLLRDGEAWIERKQPLDDDGIRISVFDAQKRKTGFNPTKFNLDRSHFYGIGVTLVQLTVASIPVILNLEWGVLFITAAGTVLAQIAGALPQWRAEKLPNRQHSNEIYALTTGNGSKDVMVIIGRGQCLDLEEFCVSDTPRNGRPWEKFTKLSEPRRDNDGSPKLHRAGTELRKSRVAFGLPYGFWVTRVISVLSSIFWLLLLINVAAVKDSTWFLLLVGAIGMFQNGILAAMERPPESRNIPLRYVETITSKKVMDGLMDFEIAYDCGRPLLTTFFPGDLKQDEKDWWDGKKDDYDNARDKERGLRGVPRRFLQPNKAISSPDRLNPEVDTVQESDNSPQDEKASQDLFSDSEAGKTSSSNRMGSTKPTAVFFPEIPEVALARSKQIGPRSRQGRVTSPTRSAFRPRVGSMATAMEVSEQLRPSSHPVSGFESGFSSLSAEEVRKSARSPGWAS